MLSALRQLYSILEEVGETKYVLMSYHMIFTIPPNNSLRLLVEKE